MTFISINVSLYALLLLIFLNNPKFYGTNTY